MANFWKLVNDVIRGSDILLEVLDARFPQESRNREIEEKVRRQGKVLIYVLNKCDLLPDSHMDEYKKKLRPSAFVSSTKKYGTIKLLHTILRHSSEDKMNYVGVLGYPNTGKSSVINALKGKGSAGTSPISGFTKGVQYIKIHSRLKLIDSPGVYPFVEQDTVKHALLGSLSAEHMKDPEEMALALIQRFFELVSSHYDIEGEDEDELLDALAFKLNMLKKGGAPDSKRAATKLLQDWQRGRIPFYEGGEGLPTERPSAEEEAEDAGEDS